MVVTASASTTKDVLPVNVTNCAASAVPPTVMAIASAVVVLSASRLLVASSDASSAEVDTVAEIVADRVPPTGVWPATMALTWVTSAV